MTMHKQMETAKRLLSDSNYNKLTLMLQLANYKTRQMMNATIHDNKQDAWGHNRQGVVSIDRRLIAYINGVG